MSKRDELVRACADAGLTWDKADTARDKARIGWDKARLALREHDKALEATK